MKLSLTTLTGRFVRLEPLEPGLREAVRAALAAPDPIWAIMATSAEGGRFDGWWDTALADITAGRRLAYAVRRLFNGEVVGSTSFLNIDVASGGVEIGSTFLRPDARGGAVNPDMKFAMLAHAFDAGALRVEIRTDARNDRSQAAIAKLGAVREGVLRRQKRLWTGDVRDTVVFSIIEDDWPAVRARLGARLDAIQG
jgi:N-acetyltransferase